MGLFKLTYYMRESGFTWGESWYFQQASDSLAGAAFTVRNVPLKRAALCGEGCDVVAQRVALITNNAGIHQTRKVKPTDKFYPGTAGKPTVPVRTSLLVRFTTEDEGHSKNMYLGGAWKEVNDHDDVYLVPNTSTWTTAFQGWVQALIDAGCGWLVRESLPKQTITGYDIDPDTMLCTYTLKLPGVGADLIDKQLRVVVDFPQGHSALDGEQIVDVISSTTLTTAQPRPAVPFVKNGTLRVLGTPTFASLAKSGVQTVGGTAEARRFTGRDRGNSALGSRGRRKAFQRA
jgi:hypothetical protein